MSRVQLATYKKNNKNVELKKRRNVVLFILSHACLEGYKFKIMAPVFTLASCL